MYAQPTLVIDFWKPPNMFATNIHHETYHSRWFQAAVQLSARVVRACRSFLESHAAREWEKTWKNPVKPVALTLAGFAVFLVIWGAVPLNVKNDAWIMASYDERDIWIHYAGWLGLRNSPWTLPLGLASEFGNAIITFTDSIPWAAILFKAFRNILPETFQYFGMWILLCCILQMYAGYSLIYFKTKDAVTSAIGALFLCFSPIMMERAFRHTALASHWLILFAIIAWQKHRAQYRLANYFWFSLLLSLAIGIHPYFIPMIAVFLLLTVIDDLLRSKYYSIFLCALALAPAIFAGWLIGALGSGMKSDDFGFGHFSMNINAPLNPSSIGKYQWSVFFKTHHQILGNYDGFNYVGAGAVAGLLLAFTLFLLFPPSVKTVITFCKRNFFFAIAMLACTLFAVSNVVTFNDAVIFTLPLPKALAKICNTFRASSRLFYPVYYCVFIAVILSIWKHTEKIGAQRVHILLFFILALQICDLSNVITQKHQHMSKIKSFKSLLDDTDLSAVLRTKRHIILDSRGSKSPFLQFTVAALKNHNVLHYTFVNRRASGNPHAKETDVLTFIKETGNIGYYLVATKCSAARDTYLKLKDSAYIQKGELCFVYSNSHQQLQLPKY